MSKKIFIASLPSSATKKDLYEVFSEFGNIKKVELVVKKDTKKCKGFAFVTFYSEEVAQSVLSTDIFFQGR